MSHWFRVSDSGLALGLVAAAACFYPLAASAGEPITEDLATLTGERLAKAKPDECFIAIGERAPINPDGTCDEGIPKVNQGYVWGEVLVPPPVSRVYFGTAPNPVCAGTSSIALLFGELTPSVNDDYACEYQEGPFSPPLTPVLGDWRRPQMFYYDEASDETVEITPADPLVDQTIGMRFAGAIGDLVILGGPSNSQGRINLFAFRASTGDFLGSTQYFFTNVRRGVVHDGVLYIGVRRFDRTGAILRVVPRPFGFAFAVQVVGNVDGGVMELAVHEGRLVATTQGGNFASRAPSGLWVSPPVPPGGLTTANIADWVKVFSYNEYDPDLILGLSESFGAGASFGDWYFFGTMHVPFASTALHQFIADTLGYSLQQIETFLNASRSIAIFRIKNLARPDQVTELLYGEEQLGSLDIVDAITTGTGSWEMVNNASNFVPVHGSSGFGGNRLLNYTWSADVLSTGRLLFGTMDYSILAQYISPLIPVLPEGIGADLWIFDDPDGPAVAESIAGVGNSSSYGVRNIIADDSGNAYLGIANTMNLRTDPADEDPGGWELLRVSDVPFP